MKGKLKTWKERNMTIFHDQEVTLGVLILAGIYFHESKKKKKKKERISRVLIFAN